MKTMHLAVAGFAALACLPLATSAATAAPRVAAAPGTLIEAVQQATAPFRDIAAAESAGYGPFHGCVSGHDGGAMGIHYVNGDLVGDGEVDAAHPEALMYEMSKGELRLVGVEYVVFAADWDATHDGPPVLMGQVFDFTGSPNRYRLPAYYELHVWAWKENPDGAFADWNPRVSCEEFTPSN